MNHEIEYRVRLFLTKIRLFKYVSYMWKKYLKHKEKINTKKMKKKQIIEIQKFGKYAEVKIGRYKIVLDRSESHDFQMLKTFESGLIYEPEVSSYIIKNLKLGETFMDIGANNGYYTVLAADLVGPSGKIISIEPNPNAFRRLMHNVKFNNLSNVVTLNVALSDHDGNAIIYLNKGSDDGQASLIKSVHVQPLGQIELKRFDHLFIDEKISIVKMDVEGSEINIIKGMENYLKSHKEVKIVMEWNPTYRTNDEFNYLSSLFNINLLLPDKELGFKIKEITEFKELFRLCNLLLETKN